MGTHDREGDLGKSRIDRMYDRLSSLLRRLSPERREAFGEYLNEQEAAEISEQGDDSGSTASGD